MHATKVVGATGSKIGTTGVKTAGTGARTAGTGAKMYAIGERTDAIAGKTGGTAGSKREKGEGRGREEKDFIPFSLLPSPFSPFSGTAVSRSFGQRPELQDRAGRVLWASP